MNTAMETGEVLHEGKHYRVLYHAGREQPAAVWLNAVVRWYLVKFYRDPAEAIAYARRGEGMDV